MLSIIIYIVAITVAFVLGRWSIKHPMPLSIHELQELRHEKSNSIHTRILKGKDRVVEFVERNGEVTNDDVENLLLVSDSTAHRYLHDLVLDGVLEQVGEMGRGVYYVLRRSSHNSIAQTEE